MHGTLESALRVEWRPFPELAAWVAQWRELAGRAVEPNIFYEPAFALAAAPVFGHDVGAGLVWSRGASPSLLGFFPARVERRRYGIALPILVGWTHPYAPLGAPLVEPEMRAAVIEAWLDFIARDAELPKLILLPYLPEGLLADTIDTVLSSRGGSSASFARHARALLSPLNMRAGYLERSIHSKKRKELRRQRKRLADGGSVTSMEASAPLAVAHALEDFFALEMRGWKGRAGTAARCHDEIRRFMQSAVSGLAAEGKARILRLCVDARAVAAIVMLRSGATAWCWKIAYDERRARFSPGVQLILDVTERLLGDPCIERVDSCATPDHPMIDHVWRERLMLADHLICPSSAASLPFGMPCTLEGRRRSVIGLTKGGGVLLRRRDARR